MNNTIGSSNKSIKIRTYSMNPYVAKELTPAFYDETDRIYAISWDHSFHDPHFEIVICTPGHNRMTWHELLKEIPQAEERLCELFEMSRKYFEPF